MRLLLLNQFYAPDRYPTADLSASLAEHRARLGDEVTVIAGSTSAAPSSQRQRAVRVIRTWTPRLGLGGLVRRVADYASYYALAAWRVARLPRQDVIVAMTTPPLIVLVAALHKRLHGQTKIVLWNMDCYPEAAERAGVIRRGGLVAGVWRAMNRAAFRRLDHLVALDSAMRALLAAYQPRGGLPSTVIPNWEEAARFPWTGDEGFDQAILDKLRLDPGRVQGRFVVLYLGNLGYGHEFDTVLAAARRLSGESVCFLFVGGGKRAAEVEEAANHASLDNVFLRPFLSKDLTPAVMRGAGCALVTLHDSQAGVMSPSKIHANLAMGLPLLYVGPLRTNVDEAIANFDCGFSLRCGDVDGVVEAIGRLRNEAHRLRPNARRAFDERYSDRVALSEFDRILDRLIETEGQRGNEPAAEVAQASAGG